MGCCDCYEKKFEKELLIGVTMVVELEIITSRSTPNLTMLM